MSDTLAAVQDAGHLAVIKRSDYQLPQFLVTDVFLTVELYESHALVSSRLLVSHNPAVSITTAELILNGDALQLVSISMNGAMLDAAQYILTETALVIPNMPNTAELLIVTRLLPDKNTALSGLYRSGKTYCTQCEAEGFRRITYYPDHPDILARFKTVIVADKAAYPVLLSNGNLAASGEAADGRHWVQWDDPFPKPSYLFALVAGDFDLIQNTFTTQSGRVIDLRIYVEKGYGDQASHAMYSLQAAMHWDEQVYGREYDLDIYMIVAIGDFNMGAMENKGLNIFNTKYVLAKPETATDDDYIHILSVIGHEYFHNWSGNRVTCRDWFQLSLKEGLTIFRDQSFTEDLISKAVMRIRDVVYLREVQFPEDAGPLAHPVRPESYIEINNFYTATVYNKGAEVLRMMQTILGRDMFRKGMDVYFDRYDGQAVTIDDFVQTMEKTSGVNLTQFKLWYSQAGTPVISVKEDYDPVQQVYTLNLSQHCPPTPGQPEKLPFYIPVRVGLLGPDGKELIVEQLLILKEASKSYVFSNIAVKPVLSILRGFSAPVKLRANQADAELVLLLKHDTDTFNRWDAGQKLALSVIRHLISDYQQDKKLTLPAEFIDAYAYIFEHAQQDKFLLAEMLSLPSETYIAEQMDVIDVDAIHAVREFMTGEIAKTLQPLLLDSYHANQQHGEAGFDVASVGARQLKNRCLSLLLAQISNIDVGMQQFDSALTTCMSDLMPALQGLVNIDFERRREVLSTFYNAWKSDALVIDKWLAAQAACKLPDTLQDVKSLMRHEAFDIKNPNKVYALIGTFGRRNSVNFHIKTGEGYAFLAETVRHLDKLNPQVAARMVNPLITWRRYDKERQLLMQEQLMSLVREPGISNDLYEIVSKSLERGLNDDN